MVKKISPPRASKRAAYGRIRDHAMAKACVIYFAVKRARWGIRVFTK
jgi:hypothetical protein